MVQGQELLTKAKRQRTINTPLPNEEEIPDFLEQVCTFLQNHETTVTSECTHGVFENYVDWWVGQRSTYKLAISEDNTVEQFYQMIWKCYHYGLPLTLTEKRTNEISFVQEIDIYGRDNDYVDPMELLNVDGAFLQLIGSTMRELYPNPENDFLDIVIFDATGMHRKKCVNKTSMRLVWPNVVVNKSRAMRIRDYMVYRFNHCRDNREVMDLKDRILSYNRDNTWPNVFHDCIYTSAAGIRMPFCDRVSPAPLKKPETRPFKPLGVWRMRYGEDDQSGAVFSHEVQSHQFEGEEWLWLKLGSIRKANGTEMTDWVEPKVQGERIRGSVQPTAPSGAFNVVDDRRGGGAGGSGGYNGGSGDALQAGGGGPTTGRDPGRVQVRTRGGSNDNYVSRGPRAQAEQMRQQQQQVQELKTIEREFAGDVEEFKQHLIQQIGQDDITFTMDGPTMVCTYIGATNGAHIAYNPLRKRVSVTGDAQQVRASIQIISRFSTSLGDSRSTMSGRTAATTRRAISETGSLAPSRIYAPSSHGVSTSTAVNQAGAAASVNGTTGGRGMPRRVTQEFSGQSETELSIQLGDLIDVQHGEEELRDQPDVDCWVYGENLRTKAKGWFPRSRVEPARG